jgi:hypothetical protein
VEALHARGANDIASLSTALFSECHDLSMVKSIINAVTLSIPGGAGGQETRSRQRRQAG